MAAIVTDLKMPKSCGGCEYEVCTRWRNRNRGAPPPVDCPVKSIDGLIDYICRHSYPVKYDKYSLANGMTMDGIEQAIREYCEVKE